MTKIISVIQLKGPAGKSTVAAKLSEVEKCIEYFML